MSEVGMLMLHTNHILKKYTRNSSAQFRLQQTVNFVSYDSETDIFLRTTHLWLIRIPGCKHEVMIDLLIYFAANQEKAQMT